MSRAEYGSPQHAEELRNCVEFVRGTLNEVNNVVQGEQPKQGRDGHVLFRRERGRGYVWLDVTHRNWLLAFQKELALYQLHGGTVTHDMLLPYMDEFSSCQTRLVVDVDAKHLDLAQFLAFAETLAVRLCSTLEWAMELMGIKVDKDIKAVVLNASRQIDLSCHILIYGVGFGSASDSKEDLQRCSQLLQDLIDHARTSLALEWFEEAQGISPTDSKSMVNSVGGSNSCKHTGALNALTLQQKLQMLNSVDLGPVNNLSRDCFHLRCLGCLANGSNDLASVFRVHSPLVEHSGCIETAKEESNFSIRPSTDDFLVIVTQEMQTRLGNTNMFKNEQQALLSMQRCLSELVDFGGDQSKGTSSLLAAFQKTFLRPRSARLDLQHVMAALQHVHSDNNNSTITVVDVPQRNKIRLQLDRYAGGRSLWQVPQSREHMWKLISGLMQFVYVKESKHKNKLFLSAQMQPIQDLAKLQPIKDAAREYFDSMQSRFAQATFPILWFGLKNVTAISRNWFVTVNQGMVCLSLNFENSRCIHKEHRTTHNSKLFIRIDMNAFAEAVRTGQFPDGTTAHFRFSCWATSSTSTDCGIRGARELYIPLARYYANGQWLQLATENIDLAKNLLINYTNALKCYNRHLLKLHKPLHSQEDGASSMANFGTMGFLNAALAMQAHTSLLTKPKEMPSGPFNAGAVVCLMDLCNRLRRQHGTSPLPNFVVAVSIEQVTTDDKCYSVRYLDKVYAGKDVAATPHKTMTMRSDSAMAEGAFPPKHMLCEGTQAMLVRNMQNAAAVCSDTNPMLLLVHTSWNGSASRRSTKELAALVPLFPSDPQNHVLCQKPALTSTDGKHGTISVWMGIDSEHMLAERLLAWTIVCSGTPGNFYALLMLPYTPWVDRFAQEISRTKPQENNGKQELLTSYEDGGMITTQFARDKGLTNVNAMQNGNATVNLELECADYIANLLQSCTLQETGRMALSQTARHLGYNCQKLVKNIELCLSELLQQYMKQGANTTEAELVLYQFQLWKPATVLNCYNVLENNVKVQSEQQSHVHVHVICLTSKVEFMKLHDNKHSYVLTFPGLLTGQQTSNVNSYADWNALCSSFEEKCKQLFDTLHAQKLHVNEFFWWDVAQLDGLSFMRFFSSLKQSKLFSYQPNYLASLCIMNTSNVYLYNNCYCVPSIHGEIMTSWKQHAFPVVAQALADADSPAYVQPAELDSQHELLTLCHQLQSANKNSLPHKIDIGPTLQLQVQSLQAVISTLQEASKKKGKRALAEAPERILCCRDKHTKANEFKLIDKQCSLSEMLELTKQEAIKQDLELYMLLTANQCDIDWLYMIILKLMLQPNRESVIVYVLFDNDFAVRRNTSKLSLLHPNREPTTVDICYTSNVFKKAKNVSLFDSNKRYYV